MASLSTHVLDTAAGRPAVGLRVSLETAEGTLVKEAVTDADGRVGDLAAELPTGDHRLRFDTGAGFARQDLPTFYPEVVVSFSVLNDEPGNEHFHVPLLLSPFGYSTYRGS
ncbi:MAG TPA: hydroxyisourate hydrolase [Nocardioides sp.]